MATKMTANKNHTHRSPGARFRRPTTMDGGSVENAGAFFRPSPDDSVCLSSVVLLTLSLILGGCATQQTSPSRSAPALPSPAVPAAVQSNTATTVIPTLPAPMKEGMAGNAAAKNSNVEIHAAELPDIWDDIVAESDAETEPAPANIAIIDQEGDLDTDRDPEIARIEQQNKETHKPTLDPSSVAESPKNTAPSAQAIDTAPDLWARIRARFSMPGRDHARVQFSKEWYAKRQDYLDRTIARATPYLHYIVEEVERRNMPSELALLPFVESAFQPLSNSHASAAGIWQFIPSTARHYGLKLNWWYDGRRDIHASTNAALDYLQKLGDQFNGDWQLALAAYNAGEGTVQRAIDRNRAARKPIDYWSLKLPKETRAYVPWLLAISEIVADPGKYNVTLTSIPDVPYLATITADSQIDLALAAELAELPLEEIHKLNPGYNRWVTDPDGPHHLLLPVEKIDAFKEKLAALPMEKRVRWTRHEVKKGESLGKIATRYGTTTALLREINKLGGNIAKARTNLLIPVHAQDLGHYVLRIAELPQINQAPQQDRQKNRLMRRGKGSTHIVKRGDTLQKVARRYGISLQKLAALNKIAPTKKILVGQRLIVRAKTSTLHAKDKSSTRMAKAADSKARRVSYKIRPGDTLTRIAERLDVSIAELRKWNPAAKIKNLKAGQTLIIKEG